MGQKRTQQPQPQQRFGQSYQRQGQQRPPHPDDQVSILVRLQKASANSKPVLLNVPRRVALKVKVGTTLSFSASNDQKYVVMDNKIHPPVGSTSRKPPPHQPSRPRPTPGAPRLPLPPSLSVIKTVSGSHHNRGFVNFSANRQRSGVTVTRTVQRPQTKVPRPPAGLNVLASGEV